MDQRERTEQRITEEVEVSIEADQPEAEIAHQTLGQRVEHHRVSGANQQKGLEIARHMAQQHRVATGAFDLVAVVVVDHDDVLNAVHDPVRHRKDQQIGRAEAGEIPEEVARKQKGVPTFYKRRKPEESELNLNKSKEYIYNFIRMLSDPYPNAFIKIGKHKIVFKSVAYEGKELKIVGKII